MKTVVAILQDLLEYFVNGSYGDKFSKKKEVILYIILLFVGLIKSADPKINSMRFISTPTLSHDIQCCLTTFHLYLTICQTPLPLSFEEVEVVSPPMFPMHCRKQNK